ncbi:MAG: hypothetical protein OEX19_04215 [Gammaproteobacteria bacterium]|nr:hypothetical protein [Gammaproteobacteria bacterium]
MGWLDTQADITNIQYRIYKKLLTETQGLAQATEQIYLLNSTALSEFMTYINR